MHVLSSSQCSSDDDRISSLGSSSERVGVNDVLTLQSFDSSGSSDVYEISDSNSDDTTLCSDIPTALTMNLLTSSATFPPGRKQLLFLYDCETTSGSHYDEHIIEIASAVIAPDKLSITKMEFTSLCHTSRRIHPISK